MIDILTTEKKYSLIYTDPPWPQKKSNYCKARPRQTKELDYPTMSLNDIENLHKDFLTKSAAQKHNVFVWTIDKFLLETEEMFSRMGYTRHARLVWDKTNGIAPAFTVRFSHEYLLWFYRKGNLYMPHPSTQGKYTTILREPATIHSKKPVIAYEMLQDMFPDAAKIELFARNYREGWDSWGNELPE